MISSLVINSKNITAKPNVRAIFFIAVFVIEWLDLFVFPDYIDLLFYMHEKKIDSNHV